MSDIEEVEPDEWLAEPGNTQLTAQVLYQRDDRTTILLQAMTTENEEQDDPNDEDAYTRYSKFSRR